MTPKPFFWKEFEMSAIRGKRTTLGVGLGALLVMIAATSSAPALTWRFDQMKLSGSNTTGDQYGWAVAISDETVVAGSWLDDDNGGEAGVAYVYVPDDAGGRVETKLTASDGSAADHFGWSVAASGRTVVVGAPSDDDNGFFSGSAYVYAPDGQGGYSETKLIASDGGPDDRFGYSVAISDDTIVVGAYLDDDLGASSGSVYVYSPDGAGGHVETRLNASDGTIGDLFGESVAISGGTIVVGASRDDDGRRNSGSAYVYASDGEGGYTETKLHASDGTVNDFFGESVAVSKQGSAELIVVGAPGDDDKAASSGSANRRQRVAAWLRPSTCRPATPRPTATT